MSSTSLTRDNLAGLFNECGPLIPDVLKVIRMNPVKPIFAHEFLSTKAIYAHDRWAGIERGAIGAVKQDRIQAVFNKRPKAFFTPSECFLCLFSLRHVQSDTNTTDHIRMIITQRLDIGIIDAA